jgi:predicted MFS family arabinose efflux permease
LSSPSDVTDESSDKMPQPTAYRWYALAVLFLVSVLNTIDKSLIPALAEPIRLEFDLSDSELGLLVGLVFSVAYGLASIPIGLLIDRVNRTRLLAGLLVAWSLLTLLTAKTSTFFGLALCRVGVAAAESGGNPTTLALISDYFPKQERGRAVGIFSINSSIATILVFSVSGFIAAEYGWRAAFILAFIPGMLLALLVLLTLKEPVRGGFDPAPLAGDEKPAGLKEIFKTIFADKTLLWITGGAILVIMGQAGSGSFAATFFVRVHELELGKAGLITGLILGLGFAIGTITGGFMVDKMAKTSPGGGCRFIAIVTMLAVPFGMIGFSAPILAVAIPCLFIFQVLGTCFYAASLSIILNLSPLKMRGSIITYVSIALNLGGYGFGPQITGVVSDLYRSLGVADPLRWALVSMVSIMLIAASFYFIAANRLNRKSETV